MQLPLTTTDLTPRVSLLLEKTINLAQAAASYDILLAAGDILIEDYNMYVSTVGATFTSVSIQTNDTVPFNLLTAGEGTAAAVTAGNQMLSAYVRRAFRLSTGKKVQFTLIGATGTGEIKLTVRYRPISVGATLT